MVRLFNYLLRQKHLGSVLVQLGGLEPPTSCSTVIWSDNSESLLKRGLSAISQKSPI